MMFIKLADEVYFNPVDYNTLSHCYKEFTPDLFGGGGDEIKCKCNDTVLAFTCRIYLTSWVYELSSSLLSAGVHLNLGDV